MWYEFRTDESLIELETQFMFGKSILVCPKLSSSDAIRNTYSDEALWKINCVLPKVDDADDTLKWYFWYDKKAEQGSSFTRMLPDNQQGIWVRGGSVLPILQHPDDMSLLAAIDNAIKLDIYLDDYDQAKGYVYMDDGQTFNFRDSCEKTLVEYSYTKS